MTSPLPVLSEIEEAARKAKRVEGEPIVRFLAKVAWSDQRHDGTRCLVWTAGLNRAGYGIFWDGKKSERSYRWLYMRWLGPIPEGLQIDHLCRNRRCVNPAHLEPVTITENWARGMSPTKLNTLKTHCPQGHPYDLIKPGHRQCSTCKKLWNRDDKRKKRAAEKAAREGRIDG